MTSWPTSCTPSWNLATRKVSRMYLLEWDGYRPKQMGGLQPRGTLLGYQLMTSWPSSSVKSSTPNILALTTGVSLEKVTHAVSSSGVVLQLSQWPSDMATEDSPTHLITPCHLSTDLLHLFVITCTLKWLCFVLFIVKYTFCGICFSHYQVVVFCAAYLVCLFPVTDLWLSNILFMPCLNLVCFWTVFIVWCFRFVCFSL